jgi:hypothetical protein
MSHFGRSGCLCALGAITVVPPGLFFRLRYQFRTRSDRIPPNLPRASFLKKPTVWSFVTVDKERLAHPNFSPFNLSHFVVLPFASSRDARVKKGAMLSGLNVL